jgi:hypothetical protein
MFTKRELDALLNDGKHDAAKTSRICNAPSSAADRGRLPPSRKLDTRCRWRKGPIISPRLEMLKVGLFA